MSNLFLLKLKRRRLIQATALAGLGAALPGLAPASEAAPGLPITRPIPSTGEILPVMGVGTNRFGQLQDAEVQALLAQMAETGGTVIDTAAMYGESETVIGRALKALGLRETMFLATKFNAPGGRRPLRDPIYGMESFERSIERLQTDHVDLLMAHFLDSVEPLMDTMLELKASGRTRYIGITTVSPADHPRLVRYMREYPIDFIQVDYSLGSRSSAVDVFPVAEERKIAVMVAVPFGGRRSSLFGEVQGRELPPWAGDLGIDSWGQLFLKYVISEPAVTCVIPGTTRLEHMVENQAAGHGVVPDAAQRRRMEQFWDEED